ncbi:MAG: ATP-dependent zinc metalloprotease FtsH [Chlamydiota bacterium]|nr:ATP-dependent zinc metalloprotease FtsH [Chlamydiota bacterium]
MQQKIPPRKKKMQKPDPSPNKQMRPLMVWLIVGSGLLYLFAARYNDNRNIEYPTYTQLYKNINAHQVYEAELSGDLLRGKFADGKRFEITVAKEDPELIPILREKVDHFSIRSPNNFWANVFFSLGPMLLFIGFLWFFVYRQMKGIGSGALSFGKSRTRLIPKDKERTTFKDVAGVEEAKEELQEIIDFLKDPKKFQRLGGRIPKGVLLIGAPGVGKTLLAKSVAGEAEVPFFTISGSDFVEMFVGVGASRVRDMFEKGKKSAPCIIFIDEIDAVGRHRGAGIGGGHDEREQTLNAILVEMDGFSTQSGVIIMAATNRPDILDPALLRPGRFDRQVVIDLPDHKGREGILKVHSRKVTLAKEVELDIIARGTPGFSGADLANLVNEAALLAARSNKKSVGMVELEEARDKVRWGRERRSRVISDDDKRITAYHESGHALVLYKIPEVEPLHKVTIIPRGMAYLGATFQLPEQDRYTKSRKEMLGQICGMLGGRIAEDMIFNEITTGASSDLKSSTGLARKMVCEWGMSEKMGPLIYGEKEEHIFLGKEIRQATDYSEHTAQEIDKEVRSIIDNCYERAKRILTDNKDKLISLAETLLKKEVLDFKEIDAILSGKVLPQVDVSPSDPEEQSGNDSQTQSAT